MTSGELTPKTHGPSLRPVKIANRCEFGAQRSAKPHNVFASARQLCIEDLEGDKDRVCMVDALGSDWLTLDV